MQRPNFFDVVLPCDDAPDSLDLIDCSSNDLRLFRPWCLSLDDFLLERENDLSSPSTCRVSRLERLFLGDTSHALLLLDGGRGGRSGRDMTARTLDGVSRVPCSDG